MRRHPACGKMIVNCEVCVISLDTMIHFYSSSGYFAVFGVLLLCGFGFPVPEDISIIAGGVISGLGYTNVHVMLLVSFAGVIVGDMIVYNMGRFFGEKIFNHSIGRKLLEQGWYDKILKSFNRNGKMVLFAARFMPGLRTPIFLTAGITKFVGFPTFIIIDGFAALISVPLWNYLGYYSASNRDLLLSWIKNTKIAIFIILFALVIFYLLMKVFRKKFFKLNLLKEE